MKYIAQPDSTYSAVGVDLEAALSSLPADRRPVFLDASDAGVIAHFAKVNAPAPILEVTMRQARLALLGAGLLTQVGTAIAGMSSPQKEAAQIEWEYSNSLRRAQPLVVQLGAALGLTSAQLDDLFVTASKL